MVEQIKDLPENVAAFKAIGQITGEDYENFLIPIVEEKIKNFKKIRFLYVLGEEFIGYDKEALWDDTKVGLKHFFEYEKIAVVTDNDHWEKLVKVFGVLMPAEVKVFSLTDIETAKQWIGE